MNNTQKITLSNPKDDSQINFKVAKLNGLKFNELTILEQKFRNVRKEANLLFMLSQSNPELLKEQFKNNPDLAKFETIINGIIDGSFTLDEVVQLFEANDSTITRSNFQFRIEVIKTMIDKKDLSEEQIEMINSEDFWMYQDYLYIKETADSFRGILRK